MNKAVFLDRDGVLNDEIGEYITRIEDFKVSKGVPEALQALKKAGYYLIVATSQAGIAKGLYTAAFVDQCHQLLQQEAGGVIDAFYYSENHPDVDTESLFRKPDSLMLEKGAAKFNISLADSWMIGDKLRDVEAGHKAGTRTIFIHLEDFKHKSGNGHEKADFTVTNLPEAVKIILEN
jgi:D-glycero-D-manno-heptose 1,7-bisphosphate phosphatase